MNKLILVFVVMFLSLSIASFADDGEQTITLKDGSQIKGQLSGIDNGVYTVKTPIIGDVHVAAGDVASITNGNVPVTDMPSNNPAVTSPSLEATPNMDQQIAAGQQKIMSNPQSMAILQQMAQDPEIMQALQDPALVQAVTSHDYQAVQNNPKVKELMDNPRMQALLKQLASQQQGASTPQ
jgi:hypothetical protein